MALYTTITPDIETRLSAWHHYVNSGNAKHKRPVITISREFGCQAYRLAEVLEKRLSARANDQKWIVLDNNLLDKIAQESGISVSDLKHVADVNPLFRSMVSMFFGKQHAEQFEVFHYLRKAITHFAQEGHCIIVGRGAASVLKNHTHCIHLRLAASYDFRLKNVMNTYDLKEAEARTYLADRQTKRDDFLRNFTHEDISNPSLYNMIFNNACNTPEEIAEIVEHYLVLKGLL